MSAETGLRGMINKKLKLGIKRSKNSKVDAKTLDSGRKDFQGNKEVKRTTGAGKLTKRVNGGKMRYQVEIHDNDRFKMVNSDHERKRIYADHDTGFRKGAFHNNGKNLALEKQKGTMEGRVMTSGLSNWKGFSKRGRSSGEDGSDDHIRYSRSVRSGRLRSKVDDDMVESKHPSSHRPKDTKGSAKLSNGKLRIKGKAFSEMESLKLDRDGNGSLKKHAKSKSNTSTHLHGGHNKDLDQSIAKQTKRIVKGQKSTNENSAVEDSRPKKKKRIIRIDPNDISNKRINDGIVTNGELFHQLCLFIIIYIFFLLTIVIIIIIII